MFQINNTSCIKKNKSNLERSITSIILFSLFEVKCDSMWIIDDSLHNLPFSYQHVINK